MDATGAVVAAWAASVSLAFAREIPPSSTSLTSAASSAGATLMGSPAGAAFRSRRYSPVTQFATDFGAQRRVRLERRLEQRGRIPVGDEHAGVVGAQSEGRGIPRSPGRRQLGQSPHAARSSHAGSTVSGGRSGSGK